MQLYRPFESWLYDGCMTHSFITRIFGSAAAGLLYILLVSPTSATAIVADTITPGEGGSWGGDSPEVSACFKAYGWGDEIACNTSGSFGKVRLAYDEKVQTIGRDTTGTIVHPGKKKTGFTDDDWGDWYCPAGECVQMRYTFECCPRWGNAIFGYKCVRTFLEGVVM